MIELTNHRLRELIRANEDGAMAAQDPVTQRRETDTAAALDELLRFRTKLAETLRDPTPSPLEREVTRLRDRVERLRGLCKSAVGHLHDAGADAEANDIHDLIGDAEPAREARSDG